MTRRQVVSVSESRKISRRNLLAGIYARRKFNDSQPSEIEKLEQEYREHRKDWFFLYSEMAERFPIYWDEMKRIRKLVYKAPYRKGKRS